MLDYRGHALNEYYYHSYHHSTNHDNLLVWLSKIPLSRPVWHYGEDFADGILTADIIHHYFPHMIDSNALHTARNMSQRTANWHYLTAEVLPKIDLYVPNMLIVDITNGVQRATEVFLIQLRTAIENYLFEMQQTSHSQSESRISFNMPNRRFSKSLSMPKRPGFLPAIKVAKQSSVRETKRNGDPIDSSTAPCKEALRLKDKEIGQLRQKVKTHEKQFRDKVKFYETLIRKKDIRIQDLEKRLEKINAK